VLRALKVFVYFVLGSIWVYNPILATFLVLDSSAECSILRVKFSNSILKLGINSLNMSNKFRVRMLSFSSLNTERETLILFLNSSFFLFKRKEMTFRIAFKV